MKEKNIKISIITVVKNDKSGLEKTLESISKQTGIRNIEHVIVDGLSNDGTIDLVKNDSTKIFISEKDNGLYFAMNKGLEIANGDFALFMNAGDIFFSDDVIEKMLNCIKDQNKVYFGNVQIYNGNFSFISEPINKNMPQNIHQYLPHHQSIFYPKTFYKLNKYDTNFKVCADADFTFSACTKFQVEYINLNIIKSYLNGFGISQYGKIKEMKKMINEKIRLDEKRRLNTNAIFKLKVYLSHLLKYFVISIFGNKGAIILMLLNRKISGFFKSSLYR